MEVIGSLVAPLVFKTSVGLNKVPGGFDSHSPPFNFGSARLGAAGDSRLGMPYNVFSIPKAARTTGLSFGACFENLITMQRPFFDQMIRPNSRFQKPGLIIRSRSRSASSIVVCFAPGIMEV